MKKNIYVDFDSTLNNLEEEWCKWVNQIYKVNINKSDILHWDWMEDNFSGSSKFWQSPHIFQYDIVKPQNGAIEFIEDLKKYFEIVIITASYPGIEKEKDKHIKRHFGDFKIIHASQKYLFTKDSILIDDKPQTINDHCHKNNKMGIVYDRDGKYSWSKLTFTNVKNLIHPKLCVARNFEEVKKLIVSYHELWYY